MSGLASLAPELIYKIGTELGNDATELRLVCKRMSRVLESHVLRSITIDITKKRLDIGISQLTTLATQGNSATTATQELYIRNLCPSKNPSIHTPFYELDSETEEWEEKVPTPEPSEVKIAEEKMQAMLRVAIASLRNLRSFKWDISRHDLEWTLATVMDAVKTLPLLESIELDLGYRETLRLRLESLSNLQSIKISGSYDEDFTNIIESLSLAIANSPELYALHVGPTHSYRRGPTASLHRILKHCPANLVLPLKHLGLLSFSIKFDTITLPHLRHLTSLTLLDIGEMDSDPDATPIDDAKNSRPEEIWATMKMINVYLEEISVNDICTTLLDYISSYSGLKKLHLVPANFSAQGESDLAAIRFYDHSLGKHVSSLEGLSITAKFEGEWCLGDRALMMISQCTKLKILEGSLGSKSLEQTERNALKSLIDVTTQLPVLEKLDIHPAKLERLRGAIGSYATMCHLQDARIQLLKCIREYEATGSSKPVPVIVLEPWEFITQQPQTRDREAGDVLKYCESERKIITLPWY